MKQIMALMLLAAMPLLNAQDQPEHDPGRRVFELKYVSPSAMARLMGYNNNRQFDDQLKVLVLNGGKAEMDRAEAFIKRFDVPPQNVEVTIYIMSALAQPSATAIPTELEGVIKQLKGMFSYKAYQLIDTQVIRTRAGQGGESSGVVDNGATVKTVSQAKFNSVVVTNGENGRTIRIDNLKVGLRIPIPVGARPAPNSKSMSDYQYLDTGISTDVDVREGQKIVVGKANMDGSDRASIVVLTAKVVE